MVMEIFKNITINISLLVLAAYLLTRVPLVKKFITADHQRLSVKLAMALIFGMIGILSTYAGIQVEGAIANTRVIGVIAGGILGGPMVGLVAGLIAGLHRFLIDTGGFTAVACAVSTVAEGLIGAAFSKYVKTSENEWLSVALVTMLAEVCQMGIILLIARPFSRAVQLVSVISGPMVLINSVGVAIFIGIFDSVFIEQDREAGNRIRLVMNIADRCLPHLRKGLYDRKNLDEATAIILKEAAVSGVAVTDRKTLLSVAGDRLGPVAPGGALPRLVADTVAAGQVQIAEEAAPGDPFHDCLKRFTAVCAPLTQHGEVNGALVLLIRKFKLAREVECEFVSGLAKLFSTQIELSQVDYQKKLRQKAEFSALQSQINPHFLFNALSTITAFCREKPERARELLIILSDYFRNTLKTSDRYMVDLKDELEHVNAYLELEKARFEEKLRIEEEVEAGLSCMVPSFILQPVVENAVQHGAMKNGAGQGFVEIRAAQKDGMARITVRDNGPGIPDEVVKNLHADRMGGSMGLANVHKRLKSIYGEEYGLQISASGEGTLVELRIPTTQRGETL